MASTEVPRVRLAEKFLEPLHLKDPDEGFGWNRDMLEGRGEEYTPVPIDVIDRHFEGDATALSEYLVSIGRK